MRFHRNIMIAVLLTILVGIPALASSTPQSTKMQGYLSDTSGGTPVPADGSYTMQFDLYDDEFAGLLIASSGAMAVQVSAGLYEVDLPFAAADFGASSRYIEITVATETLSPRVKVSSAPFAYVAEKLDGMDSTEFAEVVHEQVGDLITSGTVMESVIDPAICRDSEIMPAVLASGGPGSGLDADLLDGMDSTSFLTGSSGWALAGNTGTTAGVHFLGTTDNQSLEFRVANAPALRLFPHVTGPNVVGGYRDNSIDPSHRAQTIAGGGVQGLPNQITTGGGTIGGGAGNSVETNEATIAGGTSNRITGAYGSIGGGRLNTILSHANQTIGGGFGNSATNAGATIGGGGSNSASGIYSTIAGGTDNVASLIYSTVPGGQGNEARGNWGFAAGRYAIVDNHDGVFIWADSTGNPFNSFTHNQFLVRASGGTVFYSDSSATTGVSLPAGGGAWSTVSDINLKNAFSSLDSVDILTRLARIPIRTWSYRSQDPSVRHIGPTAQDFASAFGFGDDDRSISTIDADGVALASIQGLYRLVEEKQAEIELLENRLAELEARVSVLANP